MNWEALAVIACKEKGLEVVPYGFDGGWVFVKDSDGKVFPIGEDVVAKWINGKEGLEEIKKRIKEGHKITTLSGYKQWENDMNWLIEQAEKIERLERRIRDLEKLNKLLNKALGTDTQ